MARAFRKIYQDWDHLLDGLKKLKLSDMSTVEVPHIISTKLPVQSQRNRCKRHARPHPPQREYTIPIVRCTGREGNGGDDSGRYHPSLLFNIYIVAASFGV